MNIEESIENLRRFKNIKVLYGKYTMTNEQLSGLRQSIENVLNELGEKTEQVKMLDEAYSGAIKESKKWFDIAKNSVPKEILRNVIKELKNEISKNNKMIVEYRSTIEENRLEKEAKIDKARFDNLIYDNEIRILEEILGE